jgi:hypothetical protein
MIGGVIDDTMELVDRELFDFRSIEGQPLPFEPPGI